MIDDEQTISFGCLYLYLCELVCAKVVREVRLACTRSVII